MPVETAGAIITADGITSRPTYAFEPPAAFFAAATAAAPTGPGVYNVMDYGAEASASFDNRAAFNAAIDAAHAAGGGLVYVPPGTYGIKGTDTPSDGGVQLKDNVFLKGAGMGVTTIRVMDNHNVAVTGIVRSPSGEITKNFGLADISLDGNRANNGTAKTDGFFCGVSPGDPRADEDVYVLRVETMNNYGYGFDPHEQTHRLTIDSCVAHHNSLDGFTEDFQADGVFRNNVAYDNDRHGFNIVTTTNDCVFENNVAYNNGGAGIVVQRGTPVIDTPHNVVIRGGAVYGNSKEGINVQMSSNILITDVDVYENGRTGIRLYGSSHVTVDGNTLRDNGKSAALTYSEIQIVEDPDDVNNLIYRADNNLISNNVITNTGAIDTRYGIEEKAGTVGGNPVGNVVTGNLVSGTERGAANLVVAVMQLSGTAGHNRLEGSRTKDDLAGLDGNDTLTGSTGNDTLTGGNGDDSLDGGVDDDVVRGGAGQDSLVGGTGNDVLDGGDGRDTLTGGDGNDRMIAGIGADTVLGGAGNDQINAQAGADMVDAGDGNDVVWATPDLDADTMTGGAGIDTLTFQNLLRAVVIDVGLGRSTGAGTDTFSGFERIVGSKLADTYKGGNGADWFRGLGGADTITGGAGGDVFCWQKPDVVVGTAHQGVDHVTDFMSVDKLDLRGLVAGQTWSSVGEVVKVTDAAAGSTVAVKIDGTFCAVVVLHGLHSITATNLWTTDQILI